MLPLTPNYYAALVEYYRVAALTGCQPPLPSQELPELIQQLSLAEQALIMSSGALSLATNPATAIDQDMSDLAIAAATAAAAINHSEPSLSSTSVGVSTSPSPVLPPGFVSAITCDGDDDDDDVEKNTDMNVSPNGDLGNADATEFEQQGLSAPANDPVSMTEAASNVSASAGMVASSLLLKPFAGVQLPTTNMPIANSQGLTNGGSGTCFSPLDMLIAALDPQRSQNLATVATPQPAESVGSASLPGEQPLDTLWSSVQGADPRSYGGLPWTNASS
ncbi:hypothetical protein GGI21_003579, partial [Coemansia aciculifera]